MTEKVVNRIGWFASLLAIAMYLSYIDQIRLNIAGQSGSLLLPIVTVINCCTWMCYAYIKEKKDWPLFTCNIPGVILGIITVITALIY